MIQIFNTNHFVTVAVEQHLSKGKTFRTYWFLFLRDNEMQGGEDVEV